MKFFQFTSGEILRQNKTPEEAKTYMLSLLIADGFDFKRPVYCVKNEFSGCCPDDDQEEVVNDIVENYYQFETDEICNPSSLENQQTVAMVFEEENRLAEPMKLKT